MMMPSDIETKPKPRLLTGNPNFTQGSKKKKKRRRMAKQSRRKNR